MLHIALDAELYADLYVALFDEDWPLVRPEMRAHNYHYICQAQHGSTQTDFLRQYPEYAVRDRCGRRRQWVVLSQAHPEALPCFCER